MSKTTNYLLGGAAVLGALYLLSKNQTQTTPSQPPSSQSSSPLSPSNLLSGVTGALGSALGLATNTADTLSGAALSAANAASQVVSSGLNVNSVGNDNTLSASTGDLQQPTHISYTSPSPPPGQLMSVAPTHSQPSVHTPPSGYVNIGVVSNPDQTATYYAPASQLVQSILAAGGTQIQTPVGTMTYGAPVKAVINGQWTIATPNFYPTANGVPAHYGP